MKTCSNCKIEKPKTEFSKNKSRKDGLSHYCKLCAKERTRKYHKKHKKSVNEYNRKYYKENREAIIERKKIYQEENKEEIKNKRHIWGQQNKDKVNAAKAKRRAAKIKRTPHWLTEEDFKKIREIYKEAQRLTKETGIQHHVDHIIPLRGENVSGLHVPDNLQILTATENIRKYNKFGEEIEDNK